MDCVQMILLVIKIVDVMDKNCLCNPILNTKVEFPIESQTDNPLVLQEDTCCCNRYDFCKIKNKVISDFEKILSQLKCGIQPSLEDLLQEISLIYIYNE